MPPKNVQSTSTGSKSNSLPPPPRKGSLKSTTTSYVDPSRPSTSTNANEEPDIQSKKSEEDTRRRFENYANRTKSIRQADMQKAKTAFITMQMVDYQRRELFLQITLKDIIFYFIFLIILSFVVLGMFSSSMYYLTRALTEQLVTKQFYDDKEIPITFKEMSQYKHLYMYCYQVLSQAFHTDLESDDKNTSDSSMLTLTKENRLIGLPRFRQVRVKPFSCVLGYIVEYLGCFAEFSSQTESVEDISVKEAKKWHYFSEEKLKSLPYQGKISTYNGGGFVQNLGKTANETKEICEVMRTNLWTSRVTRCVFVDFVVYNVNLNLFSIGKLVFEFPLTGSMIPTYSFTTVKLIRYLTKWDYYMRAAEWLTIAFIIFYTMEEIREVWYFRIIYFLQFWNYLDIIIVCLGFTCIAYAITLSYEVEDAFNKYLGSTTEYANFEYVAKLQNDLNNMLAILLFLAYIKIFKYLSFNKTFGQLNNTLQRCALDILAFAIMFFIVFAAYAELGYFLFGSQINGFRTVGHALITLLRTILGDFDYSVLKNVHGILAPIYFFSFIFVVFFVLLNMFLAIINDTYSEVKVELAVAPEEIQMLQFIKRGLFRLFEICGCGAFVSKSAKTRNEYLITVDEIRGALKRSGFTDVEIRIFFNRYHIDPNAEGDPNINTLLAELEESALKSSTSEFQSAGLVTIDDMLAQEVKLHELEEMIIVISENIDILLERLDTIDSVRKSGASKR